MGTIATNENEVILYYNSRTSIGQQALPYVMSSQKDVRTVDISKTKVTGTQWATLAENLSVSISDLIDKDHPDFQKNYDSNTNLSQDDWIKVLNASPDTLRFPILIAGKKYHLVKTPSQVTNLLEIQGEDIDAQNP